MRICSLLPSATEIVYALGLGDSLVGITHECDYPPEAARLPAVTSSAIDHTNATGREIHEHVADALRNVTSIYRLDQELLERLDPDLVLTQELCEVCAVSYDEVQRAVRLLPGQRKVLSLEPMTLEGIWDTIRSVGQTAGVEEQAQRIADELAARVAVVEAAVQDVAHRPRVLAMEWLDPVFIGGHWVPEMIRLAGGTDGLGGGRTPFNAGHLGRDRRVRPGGHRADALRLPPGREPRRVRPHVASIGMVGARGGQGWAGVRGGWFGVLQPARSSRRGRAGDHGGDFAPRGVSEEQANGGLAQGGCTLLE